MAGLDIASGLADGVRRLQDGDLDHLPSDVFLTRGIAMRTLDDSSQPPRA